MLEKLLDKFTAEKTSLEKAEASSKHAYDLLMKDLTSQSADAAERRSEKASSKADKLKAKADSEADKSDTTKTMKADKKFLAETEATCAKKASDFKSRQELRAEEIAAIEKAIEIIESSSVKGMAEKHLPSFVQGVSALAQLRASSSTEAQHQALLFLRKQGQRLNSLSAGYACRSSGG